MTGVDLDKGCGGRSFAPTRAVRLELIWLSQEANAEAKFCCETCGIPKGPGGALGEALAPAESSRSGTHKGFMRFKPIAEDLALVCVRARARQTATAIQACPFVGSVYRGNMLALNHKVSDAECSICQFGTEELFPPNEVVDVEVRPHCVVGFVVREVFSEANVIAVLLASNSPVDVSVERDEDEVVAVGSPSVDESLEGESVGWVAGIRIRVEKLLGTLPVRSWQVEVAANLVHRL